MEMVKGVKTAKTCNAPWFRVRFPAARCNSNSQQSFGRTCNVQEIACMRRVSKFMNVSVCSTLYAAQTHMVLPIANILS